MVPVKLSPPPSTWPTMEQTGSELLVPGGSKRSHLPGKYVTEGILQTQIEERLQTPMPIKAEKVVRRREFGPLGQERQTVCLPLQTATAQVNQVLACRIASPDCPIFLRGS